MTRGPAASTPGDAGTGWLCSRIGGVLTRAASAHSRVVSGLLAERMDGPGHAAARFGARAPVIARRAGATWTNALSATAPSAAAVAGSPVRTEPPALANAFAAAAFRLAVWAATASP